MKLPLTPRLQLCANFVGRGNRVADIGCDHGYLSIHLLTQGIASAVIASDINEGPLQSAIRNAEKYGVRDKIRFYLSDGVGNIPRDFDDLVCAGMGADTMIHILESAPWLRDSQYRLILQCQSKTPMLRRWLSEQGWRIYEESVVRDGRFLYTVMEAGWRPEYPKLTVGEWYFPPALLENPGPATVEYYHWVVEGLRIATAHREDPEKHQALIELEKLAKDPCLGFLAGSPIIGRANRPIQARKEQQMVTVSDILNFIETLAPRSLKMDWDNVGLNCGSKAAPVRKILVALDPFEHVCQEAVDLHADLLVTHHPLIFRPWPMVTDDAAISRGLMNLVKHDISHICAHTNLDCAPGGVNDVLAEALGLQNVTAVEGDANAMLRRGEIPSQDLEAFLSTVKDRLHCDGLRYVSGGKPVHKVAVGGGGCIGGLYDVITAGCDTFVTSDVKYNDFWDAREQGINLIDAGHFHTENPVVAVLAAKIQARFPEIEVKISETHWDCVKYY